MKQVFLHHAVSEQHGQRCPCCNKVMRSVRVKKGKREPGDRRTVGHVAPHWFGEDRPWFYQCRSCNNEQGRLTVAAWGSMLLRKEDPRGERVAVLALFIDEWTNRRNAA